MWSAICSCRGPDELWDAIVDLVQEGYKNRPLWEHVADSLIRVFAGFGTGAAVGTLLGLAMGYLPTVDALCAPFIEFLRPLPQLAYLVLLIIWLGIGETSKITLLFLAALPVSAVAARDGVRNVSVARLHVAQSLGANRWQIFRHVVFPSALAEIFTGARLAIGIVYGTLIAAEIIAGNDRDRLDDPRCRPVPAVGLRLRRHSDHRLDGRCARPAAGCGRGARRALGRQTMKGDQSMNYR